MGFTKLDEGIVHSSVWAEAYPTRVLWVTMLAMCDSKGFVASSRSGLVREANIIEPEFEAGISILESPDPDSRSPEYDGRRIEKRNGGWQVLNYQKYRNFSYSSSPEAVRQRKHRDKAHHRDGSLHVTKRRDISASASSSASLIKEILNYLNAKAGKSFSPKSKPTAEHISARISEGRTLDDFKKVIDIKVAKWKGRTWPDTRKGREGQIVSGDDYLRPSTLFLPANFENYLNESATPAKVKKTLRVGESDHKDHDEAYWAEARRLRAEGISGEELSSMLEKFALASKRDTKGNLDA